MILSRNEYTNYGRLVIIKPYLNYIIGTNKYHFGDFLIFFDLEDKEETGEAGMSLEILLDTASMPARTSEYLAESFPFTLSYIFKAIL